MPLHDLGYRPWSGIRTPLISRWMVIWETGVRLVWRSAWVRRMMFLAWLPAGLIALLFFLYEQSLSEQELRRELIAVPMLPRELRELFRGADDSRHAVWTYLLFNLYRQLQGPLMILLVGIISPGLISRDLRSRAYLLYFSRPIRVSEYILGKLLVIWSYVFMAITVPALMLYMLGILLSPSWSVAYATMDLPLRILASSLILMTVTSVIALCFSSLTTETRYAAFSWFALWVLGSVTHGVLSTMDQAREVTRFDASILNRWDPISVLHALGRVQSWVFGMEKPDQSGWLVAKCAATLAVTTGAAAWLLVRRVQKPLHV